ncbi:hypothetical protein [Aquimarina sp. MMG016]|uniref:hypothetical protein n=1 Tax=Aquimarina sp. MMG016 TaxID=2822690 RepID=UPI001B3A19F4|nr:hypothetical protein [Aquimarina sp. MMG016]MBQ4818858.1 hypothetical protein [Aquimarina sp. MMG016]
MKNYTYLLFIFLSVQMYSQEFFVSFDATHKKDYKKITESFIRIGSLSIDRQLLYSLDSTGLKQKYDELEEMSSLAHAVVNEFSKEQKVSLSIKDSIRIKRYYLKNDSTHLSQQTIKDFDTYYTKEKFLLKIWEDKKTIKKINGYDCYRVYVVYLDNGMVGAEQALSYYTLYVTDQIKKPYHPIIKFKSILDKYYPLEVKQEMEFYEGFEMKYTLKELIIK